MAQPTVRTYVVSNPSVLFEPDRVISFPSAAPVGSVVQGKVDGRPVRALLTDDPLNGGCFGAVLIVKYL
ncbi:hypothetical protein OG345_42140 (plasmid) [Streptomyces sp. NBC_01220]|uniref:hypothetical protein n=1 Tax=Streptomyces sp. NBC_01220 TaxID=2903781 RepID=UPI00352D7938|nr:hypothetical protein OG345_42140 [Streptomyces sp. NBC_01220]